MRMKNELEEVKKAGRPRLITSQYGNTTLFYDDRWPPGKLRRSRLPIYNSLHMYVVAMTMITVTYVDPRF